MQNNINIKSKLLYINEKFDSFHSMEEKKNNCYLSNRNNTFFCFLLLLRKYIVSAFDGFIFE